MSPVLTLTLLLLSFALFVAAALNVTSTRFHLMSAGLALWVLVQLLALALRP